VFGAFFQPLAEAEVEKEAPWKVPWEVLVLAFWSAFCVFDWRRRIRVCVCAVSAAIVALVDISLRVRPPPETQRHCIDQTWFGETLKP